MPDISVIVPVYQVEKKIKRCVDSILLQSYEDFELWAVDDGSWDGSSAICDEYAANDARVCVVHRGNGGVSAARNAGIELSCGEYISFVDSDDFVEKNFLEGLFSLAVKRRSDMVMCNYRQTDADSGELRMTSDHHFSDGFSLDNAGIKRVMYDHIYRNDSTEGYFTLWNKLIRRDVIHHNNIRLNSDMSFGEDMLFVMDCLRCCSGISFTSDVLYDYDLQPNGLFGKYRPSFIDDIMKCYSQLREQTMPDDVQRRNSRGLELKYFYYINRHISGIVENEKEKFREIKRVYMSKSVRHIMKVIAGLTEEELTDNHMVPYELRIPKLLVKKRIRTATMLTLYSFDKTYPLRVIRDNIFIVRDVLRIKNCCKIKSLYWSLKTGGVFIVCPKSKVIVSKTAKISIDGAFVFNACHDGKNNQPGTLYLAPGARLDVRGDFRAYSGAYITVAENAVLLLKDGFINNNGKISCFRKIEIGNGVKISEDVIIRDSDNHRIVRDGFEKICPIKIGDHVWIYRVKGCNDRKRSRNRCGGGGQPEYSIEFDCGRGSRKNIEKRYTVGVNHGTNMENDDSTGNR